MPYIMPELRESHKLENPGMLNYEFAQLIASYMNCHPYNYQTFNDVIGALEAQKLELYRRCVAPYEDDALRRNGDVYDGR